MKLLVFIDDDPVLEFTFRILLERIDPDIEMVSFTRANEALEYFEKYQFSSTHLPDFVFLDIHMPVMDGWFFLERFDTLYQSLIKFPEIYMMSSSLDARDRERARNHHLVHAFIAKPIFSETIQHIASK